MPRKPIQKKEKVSVVVDGVPVVVTLHPPCSSRKSWYAYWNGLVASKSTGQPDFAEAVKAVESMLRNGGKRSNLVDTVLSDDEFEELQRRHFAKKTDPKSLQRSMKSLRECLDAISAFRQMTGIQPVTLATPDDCERFQHEALTRPKNWRIRYADPPKSTRRRESQIDRLSPNTVVKWSAALQAAFERANRNAGKKCVRGVVAENKLLSENPWKKFTSIEAKTKEIRQFDGDELISLLRFFETMWAGVPLAPLMAKVYVWSASRREEVADLHWDDYRPVAKDEHHFEVIGKWGVRRWFRVPTTVFRELEANKTENSYVFGGLPQQLRSFHVRADRPWMAKWVRSDFDVYNAGRWFYERVKDWSTSLPNGKAYTHVFRKTTLQYARQGEDVNRQVAADASVSEAVMMTNYVRERDEELRQKSNRTFRRIAASLLPEVAAAFGFDESPIDALKRRGRAASEAEDWQLVVKVASELDQLRNGRN
jgi:hypothetical protein